MKRANIPQCYQVIINLDQKTFVKVARETLFKEKLERYTIYSVFYLGHFVKTFISLAQAREFIKINPYRSEKYTDLYAITATKCLKLPLKVSQ